MSYSYYNFSNYFDNAFPNNFYIYGIVTDLDISKDGPEPQEDDEIAYNSSITIKDSDNNEVELLVGSGGEGLVDTLEKIKLGQLVMAYGYLTSKSSDSFKNDTNSNSFELYPVAIDINTVTGDKDKIENYDDYKKPLNDYDDNFENPSYDDYNDYYDPINDDPLSDMPDTNDPDVLRSYAIDNPEIPDDYFEP